MHNDHAVEINHLWCDPLFANFDGNHLFGINHSVVVKSEDLKLFSVERQLTSYQ
jgi:hypothetical protein